MINNKDDFLKKILATAAVIGTLTTGAMEASAAPATYVTTGSPVVFSTSGNLNTAGGPVHPAAVADGAIVFLGGAHDLTVDDTPGDSYEISVYGYNGQTATVTKGTGAHPIGLKFTNSFLLPIADQEIASGVVSVDGGVAVANAVARARYYALVNAIRAANEAEGGDDAASRVLVAALRGGDPNFAAAIGGAAAATAGDVAIDANVADAIAALVADANAVALADAAVAGDVGLASIASSARMNLTFGDDGTYVINDTTSLGTVNFADFDGNLIFAGNDVFIGGFTSNGNHGIVSIANGANITFRPVDLPAELFGAPNSNKLSAVGVRILGTGQLTLDSRYSTINTTTNFNFVPGGGVNGTLILEASGTPATGPNNITIGTITTANTKRGNLITQGDGNITILGDVGVANAGIGAALAINTIQINSTGLTTFKGVVNTNGAITLDDGAVIKAQFNKSVTAAGNFNLGDNADSTITFNAAAGKAFLSVRGDINSGAGPTGVINTVTERNKNVLFNNSIGAAEALRKIEVTGSGATIFTDVVRAVGVIVGNGSTATFNKSVTTVVDGLVFAGNGGGGGTGTINFITTAAAAGGAIVVRESIITTAGANTTINVSSAKNTVEFVKNVEASNVIVGNSANQIDFNGIDGDADITGGAGVTNLRNVTGKVTLRGIANTVITGNIGRTLTLDGATVAGIATAPAGGTIIVGNSTITGAAIAINAGGAGTTINAGSTLTLTEANAVQAFVAGASAIQGAGTLILENNNILTGALGADGAPIAVVQIGSTPVAPPPVFPILPLAYALQANGHGIYATNIVSDGTATAGNAALNLSAAGSFVAGTIGVGTSAVPGLPFAGAVGFKDYDMTAVGGNPSKTLFINAAAIMIADDGVVKSPGGRIRGDVISLGAGSSVSLNLVANGGDTFTNINTRGGRSSTVNFAGGGVVPGDVNVGPYIPEIHTPAGLTPETGIILFDANNYSFDGRNIANTIKISNGTSFTLVGNSTFGEITTAAGQSFAINLGANTATINGGGFKGEIIVNVDTNLGGGGDGVLNFTAPVNINEDSRVNVNVIPALVAGDYDFQFIMTNAPVILAGKNVEVNTLNGGAISKLIAFEFAADGMTLEGKFITAGAVPIVTPAAPVLPKEIQEELENPVTDEERAALLLLEQRENIARAAGATDAQIQEIAIQTVIDEGLVPSGESIQATGDAVSSAMHSVTEAVSSSLSNRLSSFMPSVPNIGSEVSIPSHSTSPSAAQVQSGTAARSHDSGVAKDSAAQNAGSRSEGSNAKSQEEGGAKSKPSKTRAAGVSSGDFVQETGVWITGFGGAGIYKKNAQKDGYKSKLYGGSLGADTALNEQLIVGGALTHADMNVSYRDRRKGNSTKADMWMLTAYGVYDFGNSFFARSIASYGSANITNKEKRIDLATMNYAIARGKFKSKTGSLEVTGGYRHLLQDNVILTPLLGLQYSLSQDGGYTETGAGRSNHAISKKSYNQFTGLAGVGLSGYYDVDGAIITPEVHASLNQVLSAKKAKTTTVQQGFPTPMTVSQKPTKTTWTLGLGATVKSGMAEFGAGYDATISKKYLGHQGSFKLRLSF